MPVKNLILWFVIILRAVGFIYETQNLFAHICNGLVRGFHLLKRHKTIAEKQIKQVIRHVMSLVSLSWSDIMYSSLMNFLGLIN